MRLRRSKSSRRSTSGATLLRLLSSLGSLRHHCVVKCVRDLTVGFCARSFGMEGLGKHYTVEHLEAWRRQAIYKWGNRPRGLEDDGSPPRYDPGYADVAPAAAPGPGSAPGKRRKGGSLYRGGLDQGPRPSPKRFRTGGSVSPVMYVQQPIPPHLQGAEPAEFMKNAVDAVRCAHPQPTVPLRCHAFLFGPTPQKHLCPAPFVKPPRLSGNRLRAGDPWTATALAAPSSRCSPRPRSTLTTTSSSRRPSTSPQSSPTLPASTVRRTITNSPSPKSPEVGRSKRRTSKTPPSILKASSV